MSNIKRLDIWQEYLRVKSEPEPINALVGSVTDKVGVNDTTPEWVADVKITLRRLLGKCKKKYAKPSVSHHNARFIEENKDWLSECETFPLPSTDPVPSTSKTGRPKVLAFKDLGERSKRKRTQSMREAKETEEIAHATHSKLRSEGKIKAAKVVKKVMEASPRTVSVIFTAVEKLKRTMSGNIDDGSPKAFSVEESVVHQIECDFTKEQYILNRQRLKDKNCPVFPSYDKISEYKKKCIPNDLLITETKACVSLQNLLDHTASRIVFAQQEVLNNYSSQGVKISLVSKIGFDGSSNHSQYNQLWKDFQANDGNLVLTAVVPLLLHHNNTDSDKVSILWMNQKPSSIVHCRPLELEFSKETTSFIKEKSKEIQEAINNLEVTLVEVNGILYEVEHCVLLTMVDGKISSVITETSNQRCNVCKAPPSQMNDIDAILLRDCDTSALQYGISVLHLNIRFLEYFMNIAKRRGVVEKCFGKYTDEQMQKMKARHTEICKRLNEELGLRIDQVSPKGGNTNTGNNARRFFDHAVKIAEITGLDLDVLQKCRVVLRTLSCGYAINVEIFQDYCVQLARELVHKYGFWYMPSAVHTALIHGAAFIRALPVPIGMLSEEPLESSHKVVRELRLRRTRKISRVATMTDLFRGLLIRTDPIVASMRRPPKPKGSLDSKVVSMLLSANETGGFSNLDSLIDDDESDIDEPDQ